MTAALPMYVSYTPKRRTLMAYSAAGADRRRGKKRPVRAM